MISLLTGTVRSLSVDKAIIEVNGVGYAVNINAATGALMNLGTTAQLFTSLIVREDSLTLYGFLDDESRDLFELVQTVSGIGPKVALSILGALSPSALATAVAHGDAGVFERVPGIGKKGAQRMALELKGKITPKHSGGTQSFIQPAWREQLASALISLGFSTRDSDAAITSVLSDYSEKGVDPSSIEISELLKACLQSGRRT